MVPISVHRPRKRVFVCTLSKAPLWGCSSRRSRSPCPKEFSRNSGPRGCCGLCACCVSLSFPCRVPRGHFVVVPGEGCSGGRMYLAKIHLHNKQTSRHHGSFLPEYMLFGLARLAGEMVNSSYIIGVFLLGRSNIQYCVTIRKTD